MSTNLAWSRTKSTVRFTHNPRRYKDANHGQKESSLGMFLNRWRLPVLLKLSVHHLFVEPDETAASGVSYQKLEPANGSGGCISDHLDGSLTTAEERKPPVSGVSTIPVTMTYSHV